MNDAPSDPISDPARLEDLAELEMLDTPTDADFDRLTRLASRLLGAPVSLVSLVAQDRQFFKSCVGLPEPWASRRETPLSHSFCQHVVRGREPLVIDDARRDPLVRDNLAVADLGVVAYLGVPLVSDAGRVLGSFCAIDVKPRKWTEADVETLRDLAASVTTELRLRREQNQLRRLHGAIAAHRDSLQVMLTSIGDAVIATDAGGLVSFLNPVAEQLTGWPAVEAVGRPVEEVFQIVHESTRRPVEQPVRKVLEEGVVKGLANHTTLIARDGVERPISDSAAPIKAPSGAAVGVILVFRDVTEQREADRKVEAARTYAENVVDTVRESLLVLDPDLRVAVANRTYLEEFRVDRAAVVGRLVTELGDGQWNAPRLTTMLKKILPGATSFRDYQIERDFPGLGRRVMRLNARAILDEQADSRLILLAIEDVTDRIAAERSLHESEARYRSLFDSIDEGFCIIEMIYDARGNAVDYRFLETNPAFRRQTGLENAQGRTIRELAPVHEDYWFEIYGAVAVTGEPVRFVNEAKELDDRWYDVYAFRVGEPEHRRVAVLFNDVSGRIRSEREREEMVERLKDADRMKDQFLAMLAHELRNPLSAISVAAQIAHKINVEEAVSSHLGIIQRQTRHLARLVDDLLDVSRISQGKIRLRMERTELLSVVDRAVELARPAVDAKRHRLSVSSPDVPVTFQADPVRVEQILGNLLTNAAKYTEPGGSIVLDARREDDEIVLRVKDDGMGISQPMQLRIFDLFAQVDASLAHSQGGLGIGLTLVKNLVELHGGTIAVASAGPGEGSEFTVRLPLGARA